MIYYFSFQCFYNTMCNAKEELPPTLVGKINTIFGNIKEIYEFHSKLVIDFK